MSSAENGADTQAMVTGKAFCIRLFVIYGLFVGLHHFIYPETGSAINWTAAQFVVLSILTYTVDFLAPLVSLGITFFLVSKAVPSFRSIPVLVLFNRALYTAIPIYCLMLFGWYSYNNLVAANPQPASEAANAEVARIITATTSQNAEGLTEDTLTVETLTALKDWVVDEIREKANASNRQFGVTQDPVIDASATYVTIEDRKVAVIKISLSSLVQNLLVIGFVGDELIRVSCIREGAEDIPMWYGPCSDEIYKSLGLRFSFE